MAIRLFDYIFKIVVLQPPPALAEDWAVPMDPDVTAFEKELDAVVGAVNVVALEFDGKGATVCPLWAQ